MPDSEEEFERRLAAVERAVEGESEPDPPNTEGAEIDDVASRVATLESRVDELDAALQSVRGFLGGVSAVNEAVERRADAAVAAVERLETHVDGERPSTADGATVDASETPSVGGDAAEPDSESEESGLRERLQNLQ